MGATKHSIYVDDIDDLHLAISFLFEDVIF